MAPPRPSKIQNALWGLLFVLGAALTPVPGLAQADEPEGAGVELLAGVRGVGEIWQDSHLIDDVGRSSRFGGTGFLSTRVWRFLSADVEVGYLRMAGTGIDLETGARKADATTFELVPMALTASAIRRAGGVEVFGSLGVAATVYSSSDKAGTISGTKFGPVFAVGARLDTGLVQPSIRRDKRNVLQGVDLELVVGRRQHQPFGIGEGLDLSAWRVGVGLLARL